MSLHEEQAPAEELGIDEGDDFEEEEEAGKEDEDEEEDEVDDSEEEEKEDLFQLPWPGYTNVINGVLAGTRMNINFGNYDMQVHAILKELFTSPCDDSAHKAGVALGDKGGFPVMQMAYYAFDVIMRSIIAEYMYKGYSSRHHDMRRSYLRHVSAKWDGIHGWKH